MTGELTDRDRCYCSKHNLQQNPTYLPTSKTIENHIELFETGPALAQSRIIDGVTADVRNYQFYALISYREYPKPNMVPVHCGGALIHPLFVVSAFHCFKNVDNPQK